MRFPAPDKKWRTLVSHMNEETAPTDVFLKRVYAVMKGESDERPIREALDLIVDRRDRDVLVAFFLSGATFSEISESLWINEETLKVFRVLVVDPEEFRNKLELFKYARHYADEIAHEDTKEYIRMGIEGGPDSLILHHRHGREEIKFDVREHVKQIVATTASISRLLKSNYSSAGIDQFVKMATLSTKSATILEGQSGHEDAPDALVAIEERRKEMTAETLGVKPDELLH